ncbi:LuxR C-terminal-related transcriptional regulator [Prescottella subtropica]|uniref:LuxR C-terminal-related transcriptional regulator n=1 Tax=Prescottella subtropica TaxID=2545757 RepID=UPI0010F862D7|nr:LuxR C-terminal-related transcriptional regulator [Prescottella subtropica]
MPRSSSTTATPSRTSAALACLVGFLEATPVHTVVAARWAPNLPWAKFAAEGSLAFLGWEDLALDRQTVAEEFTQRGCFLDDTDLDLVLEITGGWAGAVYSAAVVFGADRRARPAITELLDHPQLISAYVVGETMDRLPADLARAVRSTSGVEWFTGRQLADHGVANADPALYLCEQHGVPVRRERIGGELRYSWHPLVRAHVNAGLPESGPAEYRHSTADAVRQVVEFDCLREVFVQLMEVSDDRVVDEFVYRYGLSAVFGGNGDDVFDTVGSSHGYLTSITFLRVLAALEANDPDAARAYLRSVATSTELPAVAKVLSDALTIEAALIGGWPIPAEAISRLENTSSTGNLDIDCYALIQLAAALLLARRHRESECLLREVLTLAGNDGHPRLVLRAMARLAGVAVSRGNLVETGERAERAVAYAVEQGLESLIDAAQSAATLGMCRYYRGEPFPDSGPLHELSSTTAVHVHPDGTTSPTVGHHAAVTFALLRARYRSSQADDVASLARAMSGLLCRAAQPGLSDRYVPEAVAVFVDAGRLSLAVSVVQAARDVFGDSPEVTAARAMLALADGEPTVAEQLARKVVASEPAPRRVLVIEGWVLVAVAAFRDRRRDDAVTATRQALLLAETDEIVRPFLHFAGDTAELLSTVRPGAGVTQQFLDHARGKLAETAGGRNPGLTRSEKAVLAQLHTGKVLRLIAKDMHLSVNTVRTHAHSLYRKLDVTSREGAVEEAVRRGLL